MTDQRSRPQRYQVFVIGINDYLRTPAGAIRLFESREEAQRAADEHGGILQSEGSSPPGGFDRTFG